MRSYKHVQTSPASTWVVQHNFNANPVSDVFIDNNGMLEKILPESVIVINSNTLQINFSTTKTGEVRAMSM